MHILFVNQHASAPQFGNPYRFYYLARALIEAGHEVSVVTASFSHMRQVQPNINHGESWQCIDGISFFFLPVARHRMDALARTLNIFEFAFQLWRSWKIIVNRYDADVVVEATPQLITFYVTRKIASRLGATLVLEVRDLWPQSLIELSNAWRWNPLVILIRGALKSAVNGSAGVISTLCKADQYFYDNGLRPRSFFCVQNGVEPQAFLSGFTVDTETSLAIDKIRNDFDAVIGYAGTIGRANAVSILLDSAQALKDLNVAIVLIGQGERREELRRRVEFENINNFFIFDAVPKKEVSGLIRKFDLGFLGGKKRNVHRYGVSPNKLFDYMANSVPVLFCIDSPDRIVETSRCGYEIKNPTPEQIVSTTRAFLTLSPHERRQMGLRGKDYAKKYFSFDNLAEQFVDALASIKDSEQ